MSRIPLRSIYAAVVTAIAISLSLAGARPASRLFAADSTAANSATQAKVLTDTSKPATAKARNPRVLVITAKNDLRCDTEMKHMRSPGGTFAKLRAAGWTVGDGPENMVQIVDRDAVPELAAKIDSKEYPAVCCVDGDEVVRYFKYGCTTPLDTWTFGFMAKGVDERPAGTVMEAARVESTGSYPLRGNHWSFEGDWNPTKDFCIAHLRGPVHAKYLLAEWKIEDWSIEELKSLHDDLHEKYPDGGAVNNGGGSSSDSINSSPATAYRKFKG
jgi:hypothetical protein